MVILAFLWLSATCAWQYHSKGTAWRWESKYQAFEYVNCRTHPVNDFVVGGYELLVVTKHENCRGNNTLQTPWAARGGQGAHVSTQSCTLWEYKFSSSVLAKILVADSAN